MSKKNKKLKSGWRFLLTLVVLLALVIGGYNLLASPVTLSEPVTVTIDDGSSSKAIASTLADAGVIRSKLVFSIKARSGDIATKMKAGQYSFNGRLSLQDIIDLLVKGTSSVGDIKVTVPEGLTVKQTADIFAAKGVCTTEAFIAYCQDGDFNYEYLPAKGSEDRLEGFLFPETYMIGQSWTEKEVVTILLRQFDKEYNEAWRARTKELDMTIYQAVTLASIVEKEAKIDKDRPLIAGVFYNRLAIDMPLQSCATVQYILGEPKDPLLYADLEIDSPYNTYKYSGLPVGPIAAPGRKSLEATLYPTDSDYYYFRANSDGSHAFSKTLQEHNAAGD